MLIFVVEGQRRVEKRKKVCRCVVTEGKANGLTVGVVDVRKSDLSRSASSNFQRFRYY